MSLVAQVREITDAKRAAELLEVRAFMLESMVEGVTLVDRDGIIRFANPAEEILFGYGLGELLGKHVSVLNDYPPEESQPFVASIIQGLKTAGQFSGEFRNRKQDGTPFLTKARIKTVNIGGEEYWLSLQHDITERRHAEEALRAAHDELETRVAQRTADLAKANIQLRQEIARREQAEQHIRRAEEKYRTLVEQLPAITYITALDYGGRFIYISPQVESMLGFSPAECLADPNLWVRQLHPDDRLRVLDLVKESSTTGKPFSSEHRLLARDGQVRWLSVQGIVVRDDTGQPLFRRGVMIDITGQKEAEEELKSLNARTTNILEHMAAAFFAADHEGRITYANPSAELLAGRPRDMLVGRSIWEVFPKMTGTVFYKQYERVRAERVALEVESYVPKISKWLKAQIYPTGDGVSALT